MTTKKIKLGFITTLLLVNNLWLLAQNPNSAIWALNTDNTSNTPNVMPQTAAQSPTENTNSAMLVSFFVGNWQQAQRKATAEGKHLVVEIYSGSIGNACRRMESKVFTNPLVADIYNNNYLVLRLNIDNELDPINRQFLNEHPVAFIPSYFYFNPKGDFLTVANGFQDTPKFLELGQNLINN